MSSVNLPDARTGRTSFVSYTMDAPVSVEGGETTTVKAYWLMLLLCGDGLVSGGEFRSKLNKAEVVTLAIPRPADASIKVKVLGIGVKPTTVPFRRVTELVQFIQQDLSKEFEISNTKPEATFQFAVVGYEPVLIKNQTETEMRSINAGTADKPNYQSRSVPVVYQLIHGSITLSAYVFGSSGQTLDAFQPSASIDRKTELTVNGQAPGPAGDNLLSFNPLKGFTRPGAKQQPRKIETDQSLELEMLQQVGSAVQRRYVSTTDAVEIALAVDPELRLGDKLAESGQWPEALQSWTSADMKRNPSDRLYNMAVAKEALAYRAFAADSDMESFQPRFQEAMSLYTQGLHGDPAEKYMRQAVDRLELAKSNIEAARRNQVVQQQESERAIATAGEQARQAKLLDAALHDRRPDTQDEASFRMDVRAQLSEVTGEIWDNKRDELIAFGQRLNLSKVASYRVVAQEIEHKKDLKQALNDYERVLRPYAADGQITSTERAHLRSLATRENLDDSEVKLVESKYHFTEQSSASPGDAANKVKRSTKPL